MPILEKETQLYGYSIEELEGRTITYDLTRFLRGKSMILKLRVQVENEKASSYPVELKLMPYFLRRMVRKGTNYVEDSFSIETKDAIVRIKPFLITRKKVSMAVKKALRNRAREELTKELKDKNTETIFEELLKNQIQKPLSLILKKIYPLSLCEIRVFRIEKELKEDSKEIAKKKSVKKQEEKVEKKESEKAENPKGEKKEKEVEEVKKGKSKEKKDKK